MTPANWPGITRPVLWINLFRQHDGRRQIVSSLRDGACDRRRSMANRYPSAALGLKPGGNWLRPVSMIMVSGRMVVRWMRKRPHERPLIRSSRQLRQMFANLHARRLGRDRLELAANIFRSVRLQVKTVVLSQSAGQEDVDNRLGGMHGRRLGTQSVEVRSAQAEQRNSPGLQHGAAGEGRM